MSNFALEFITNIIDGYTEYLIWILVIFGVLIFVQSFLFKSLFTTKHF